MVNCHCRDCQRASGSAFSATVIMARDAVRLTRGALASFEKTADSGHVATRSHCAACGTPIFASSSGSADRIGLKASSLDDPSWYRPDANVWLDSAVPWYRPDPTIPGFGRNRLASPPAEREA